MKLGKISKIDNIDMVNTFKNSGKPYAADQKIIDLK